MYGTCIAIKIPAGPDLQISAAVLWRLVSVRERLLRLFWYFPAETQILPYRIIKQHGPPWSCIWVGGVDGITLPSFV